MTVEEISSRINNVDSGLDQRRMLVNILKEKLGMPAAASPPPPQLPETAPAEQAEVVLEVDGKDPNPGGSAIDTVIAEVDRTYGERKRIIDALRVQISVSAAQPKSASLAPPRPYVQATAPPEKRAKTSVGAAAKPVVPLAPAPLLATTAAPVPLAAPLPPRAPALTAAQQAEQALLEARKSKMLQNLRVAEQLGAGPAMGTAPEARTAMPQMLPPVPVAPTSQPGGAGIVPGGGAMPPSSGGMNFPPAPVGATPEEYEAYRQDCWRQYNQYVNAWQKYYNKNKAEKEAAASGAQKKASAPRPQAQQWPSGPQSGGGGAQSWPAGGAAPPPPVGGQPTASAPRDQRSMDEIIHSELLGL
mmetsp:Transcript_17599/g.31796  ORF Transcript_17599/g.31796 Transcript_17599/m.31796 type:complete len:359 (-) Transcript_17599:8-1084(-)